MTQGETKNIIDRVQIILFVFTFINFIPNHLPLSPMFYDTLMTFLWFGSKLLLFFSDNLDQFFLSSLTESFLPYSSRKFLTSNSPYFWLFILFLILKIYGFLQNTLSIPISPFVHFKNPVQFVDMVLSLFLGSFSKFSSRCTRLNVKFF